MRVKVPLAFLLLTLCSGFVQAQVSFSVQDCQYDTVANLGPDAYEEPWKDLHPTRVYERLKPIIQRSEWGVVGSSLAQAFRLSDTVPTGTMREVLQAEFDAFAAELRAVENEPGLIERGQGVDGLRFDIDSDPMTFDITLFPESAHALDLNSLGEEERRDVCWRAMAARRVLVRYMQSGRQRAVNALDSMIKLWDSYNENSYSQYPWELWINGLASGNLRVETLEDLAPPITQIVFFHPGVALEASGVDRGLNELRRLDVLMIEPIGILRYKASRTSYLGASLLVTVASDVKPGIGGLLHFGDRIQAGFVYRDAGEAGQGSSVVLSVDVFKLLSGTPTALKKRTEVVRALLPHPVQEND